MSADPISVDENDARETISEWLRSWRGELMAAWRDYSGRVARESGYRVHVAFAAHGTTIACGAPAALVEIASIPPGTDDQGRHLASALSEACTLAKTKDVTVSLPSEEVLRPHVKLPYVSRRAIRPMLGFELERLSPLPLDELYFDYQVTARDRKTSRTEIDLRIVKRDIVDRALSAVHAAGFAVSALRIGVDEAPADWRAFPVDRMGLLRDLWRRFGVAALAGLAVVLAIAIVAAAYARGAETLSGLEDQLDTQQLQAAQVDNIRSHLANARAQIEFASAKKAAQPSLLAVVSALTDALPDGTWLTDIGLQGRKAHMQGYSHSASDLIALIDRAPGFANAQFNAPVVQSSNKLDRFDITFDVKAEKP